MYNVDKPVFQSNDDEHPPSSGLPVRGVLRKDRRDGHRDRRNLPDGCVGRFHGNLYHRLPGYGTPVGSTCRSAGSNAVCLYRRDVETASDRNGNRDQYPDTRSLFVPPASRLRRAALSPDRRTAAEDIDSDLLSRIPFIGPIFFEQNILTYSIYLLVPLGYFILYKTSLGLVIRSTGENPEAVDVSGISVSRVRFVTVSVSGIICGIAGAFYSIGYLGMFTTNMIGGRGWIAFAICFLGNWNPIGAFIGTLIFGLAEAFAILMQANASTILPNELFIALPYVLTIVLTISRRSFNVPSKLGIAYYEEN